MNGAGVIRTRETVASLPPFQGGAFSHSATAPKTARNVCICVCVEAPCIRPLSQRLTGQHLPKRFTRIRRIWHTLSRRVAQCTPTLKTCAQVGLNTTRLIFGENAYLWYSRRRVSVGSVCNGVCALSFTGEGAR